MSEKHGHSENIASLKANVGDDTALMEPIMSYRSILDGENPIVNYNEILLGALERMKAKYHDSERGMLQLEKWEARAEAEAEYGTIMPGNVFTPDSSINPELLTFRRIIGIISHPKALRDDERVKDALLIADSMGADYISDRIAGLVADLDRSGATGDTMSKLALYRHGGKVGRDILGTEGINLPKGFKASFMTALGEDISMEAGNREAQEAAYGFVYRVFHPSSLGSRIFQEVTARGGLWDRLPSLKGANPMEEDAESDRSGAGIEGMEGTGYANLLAMCIWIHDLIGFVADYGKRKGLLPNGWRGGLIITGTAENLMKWMASYYGDIPDDSYEALNDASYQDHNDDNTISIPLPEAVLRMPDGRPNFGSAYKPLLTIGPQMNDDDEPCD